jgi:hypothetical protein
MKIFCIAILLLTVAVYSFAQDAVVPDKNGTEKEVMQVLEDFMSAFNRVDVAAWESTFHFPHYRLASGKMHVLNSAGQRKASDLKQYLESIGWHHSAWDRRNIIHATDTKAHVDTTFTRYRKDGSIIGSYESLYILTRKDGKWGVTLRSSFAQ